jgi:arylsulfatase A-like enzyme
MEAARPNLLFVFADQWRAQAAGYAGDPNVRTPRIDAFAAQSVEVRHAVTCCPVCSPYRACLLTGQYPLTHRIIVNDQLLQGPFTSFAEALNGAGYHTAYLGKWHLHGGGRSKFIPREHRLGFRYWKVLECTHEYNASDYYGDTPEKLRWDGYDALAQTRDACAFLRERRAADRPFALFLSWGPPHNPFHTAPEEFRRWYDPPRIQLRPNVPPEAAERARNELAGYYAHVSALDFCFGLLLDELKSLGLEHDTLVVLTSDHGDMLGSQGLWRKQHPYDESLLAPFLARGPGLSPRLVSAPLNAPDLMPTVLGLLGVGIPASVEGENLAEALRGARTLEDRAALFACYIPFHELPKPRGREFRGVRTARYTYARDRNGPWLLFDNREDPYQMRNLVGAAEAAEAAELRNGLEAVLERLLREREDEFLSAEDYVRLFGFRLSQKGDIYCEM